MSHEPDDTRAALAMLLDAAGEVDARRILRDIASPAVRAEFERLAVVRLAVDLLDQLRGRAVVADRLMARGLSRASAYRRIEAALDMRRGARSLTAAGTMRHADGNLSTPEPLDILTMTEPTIKHEAQRAELASLRESLAATESAIAAGGDALRAAEGRLRLLPLATFQVDRDKALGEVKQAKLRVRELESKAETLRAQIRELQRLLSADQRTAEAVETAATAAGLVDTAADAVQRAAQACDRIRELIAQEEAAYTAARASAAADLLAAVKAGGDAAAVAPASRDRIATLEEALASADGEHAAAKAALQAAKDKHGAALRAQALACVDVAELAHVHALGPYVAAAAAYVAAHERVHGFGPSLPNVPTLVAEAALQLVAAEPAA